MIAKANRPRTVKQQKWINAMLTGVTPTEAARQAGYAKGQCDRRGYENVRKSELMQEIDKKRAETGAEVGRTVQSLDLMYQQAYDKSLASNQPSAMVSAVTGIARLYGMDKDNQTGKAEAPDVLTPEQLSEAKAMANRAQLIRLSQEGA